MPMLSTCYSWVCFEHRTSENRNKIWMKAHEALCTFIRITSQEHLAKVLELKNAFNAHNVNKFLIRKLDSHSKWKIARDGLWSEQVERIQNATHKICTKIKRKTPTFRMICTLHINSQRRKINFLIGNHCDFIVVLTFLALFLFNPTGFTTFRVNIN